MKQVLLDLQSGSIRVENVPVPANEEVVVENAYSSSVPAPSRPDKPRGQSLIGKAKARPRRCQESSRRSAPMAPFQRHRQAMSRLSKPEPLGYSSAGTVVATGTDFEVGPCCLRRPGMLCMPEVSVPKNLCVRILDGVGFREAAFTTVGSIAMHGVRKAAVTGG